MKRRTLPCLILMMTVMIACSRDNLSEQLDAAPPAEQGVAGDGPELVDLVNPDSAAPDLPKPTCTDKAKNGDETDTDCGGATCPKCADGKKCSAATDCQSGQCKGGICVAASCTDKVKNGAETDIDCGGAACGPCGDGKKCTAGTDCQSTFCINTACKATCTDGVKNGGETDTDCGGKACTTCANGKKCAASNDCTSGVCNAGTCAGPGCNDGVKNGTETDTDCGGKTCAGCAKGKACLGAGDCKSKRCVSNACAAASCSDGVKNGTETDVDCGGACTPCATGKNCKGNTDCASKQCAFGTVCLAPSCSDKVKNGGETDIDCGGSCPKCADSRACKAGTDCASGVCASGVCASSTCSDKLKNGHETDVDCGGTTCPACAAGKKCKVKGDCSTGVCAFGTVCLAPSCSDGVKNGNETDVDCGGGTCKRCGRGKKCAVCNDCAHRLCKGGTCALATSCKELKTTCGAPASANYTIDATGGSTADAFTAYCDMTTSGGGWTLVATTADDGQNTWSYATRHYLWDKAIFGSLQSKHRDFKSRAYYLVPFTDMLFVDKQNKWGVYGAVNSSGKAVAGWMPTAPGCATTSGRSFKMTAGNLTAASGTGKMNNTNLYVSVYDYETCACTATGQWNHVAYGPTWAYLNNNKCAPDDPGMFGWGPGYTGSSEMGRASLGDKPAASTESSSGDYIWWYVR